MPAKKATGPAQPAEPEPSPLFRMAEILHMRRQNIFDPPPGKGVHSFYECTLCMGKSADLLSDIEHKPGCPVLKV